MARSTYDDLVAKGCTCGGRAPGRCPLHPEPSDNRGLRAWLESGGLFRDFPMEGVTCGKCGAGDCLMYPVGRQTEEEGAPQQHDPSVICANCSTPAVESYLRFCAEQHGFELKPVCIFTTATRLLVETPESTRLGDPAPGWEPIEDPDEIRRAVLGHLEPEAA